MKNSENPFKIHGIVEREYFTDRTSEIRRIAALLREPGAKLLVFGARRMGKSSAVKRAVDRVNRGRGRAFVADLSTASTPIDMGNRILRAATRVLGRRWRDFPNALLKALGASVKLTIDPVTSMPTATFETGLRSGETGTQRQSLVDALDSIDRLAGEKGIHIGIVLDEFQEIHRFGGEDAEWQLRGVIQNHHHLSYVLVGSKTPLIDRMIAKDGAFYGMLDHMEFGPIDPEHLARWIDGRFVSGGIKECAVGERVIARAGPRTRDIIQLARRTYDRSRAAEKPDSEEVDRAFVELAEDNGSLYVAEWERLTQHQQNVLRAAAAGDAGLTTKRSRDRFALGESGTATNAARALVGTGILLKTPENPTGYTFDNPFFREWVRRHTIEDLGA